jgi:hypothetical protein
MPTLEIDGQKTEVVLEAPQTATEPVAAAPTPTIAKKPVAAPKPATEKPTRTRASKTEKPRTAKAPVQEATPEVTEKRTAKVKEILDLSSATLLVFGKGYNNAALRADGHMLSAYSQPLSEAVANVAAHDPAVARMLDNDSSGKLASYVGLASVAVSLGAQIAANHGVIKPGTLGTAHPLQIIDAMEPADDNPPTA